MVFNAVLKLLTFYSYVNELANPRIKTSPKSSGNWIKFKIKVMHTNFIDDTKVSRRPSKKGHN